MSNRQIIKLKKIRLINWYGFNQITVPIGNFTLIAGKNGNGKSVLLDGIKYALYGDTVFNKSTENKGSRTVSSYTRGLLDATAGTYMRPADQYPNVHTHIVLELANEIESFILGTVIDTDAGNNFRSFRYVVKNKNIEDLPLTFRDDAGRTIPYDHTNLQKQLNVEMMEARKGILTFMQRTGLRLSEDQLMGFRRKLRNMMSYDPNAKIDQFIRESVLEEKKIDFDKLIQAKNNIQNLKENIQSIDGEIQELEQILQKFDTVEKLKDNLLADDIKQNYQQQQDCQKLLKTFQEEISLSEKLIKEDSNKLTILQEKKRDLQRQLNDVLRQKEDSDLNKPIAAAQEELTKAQQELQRLTEEKETLISLQEKIQSLLKFLEEKQETVEKAEILTCLTDSKYNSGVKSLAVNDLQVQLETLRDRYTGDSRHLKDCLEQNAKEIKFYRQIVEDCLAHKTTYSELPDYLLLKQEINKEFAKRKINSQAWLACEKVTGLKDEAWRNALETFLGRRRYTILVEPEYYSIADDVLNRLKNPNVHLFNTYLLQKKDLQLVENSAAEQIQSKNAITKKYFDYQLGRLHAVPLGQVKNYENAISKEGRVSLSMDGYFLNFAKLRYYYLGSKAIELNKQRSQRMLKKLETGKETYQNTLSALQESIHYLQQARNCFVPCNYDAVAQQQEAEINVLEKKKILRDLKKALKNDSMYMELCQREEDLEDNIQAAEQEENNLYSHRSSQETNLLYNEAQFKEKNDLLPSLQAFAKEQQESRPSLYEKAITEYENHLSKGPNSQGGILKDRRRAENSLNEASTALSQSQAAYGVRHEHTDLNADRTFYADRKNKIWMDDREEIQANLQKQTHKYEEIFKNEFVLSLFSYCNEARRTLRSINAELANLKFKSQYAFQVHFVKDGSHYEQIINYARYLQNRVQDSDEGQLSLEAMTDMSNDESLKLEKEIQQTVNEILSSDDRDQLEHYADYRNYMTYEITLTNDVLTEAKLSKQSGYNSGAEVQIPYMLILLSALLMIYNLKDNCTRLVFIDEPFAKMDPVNVEIMLDFMKQQELQMIFCAPDKTELIGNKCDVILPVLRTKPNLMEVGFVKMKA